MSLPTKDKTWEFPVVNQNLSTVSDLTANQDAQLQAKDAMISGSLTSPWTVIGSSDSVTAAMDGVDRWSTLADVVFDAPPNPHSWIVLEQPGIQLPGWSNPLQVCLSCNGGTFGTDYSRRSIIISPGDGFGVANGGTDGSTTAEPTATDQWAPFWQQEFLSGSGAMTSMSIHVLVSDDGEVTRIIYGDHSGSPFCRGWLSFEMLQNPVPGLAFPFVCRMRGGNSSVAQRINWDLETYTGGALRVIDPGNLGGRIDQGSFRKEARAIASTLFAGSQEMTPHFPSPHAITGEYILTKANLISRGEENPGYRGFLGTMYDLYFIGTNAAPEDMLPAAGNKTWANLGGVVIPWLDDSATNLVF